MSFIEKIEVDPAYPDLGIIVATDLNGYQMRYLYKQGILHPVRIWLACTPTHRVTFAIPIPDGMPEVLSVTEP